MRPPNITTTDVRRGGRPWWGLALVMATGCSEVLDFGTVCASDVPRVNLHLFVPDPLAGAECETSWNGIGVDVLTPEGAPTFVSVVMDTNDRTSSGKAGLVTAGREVPLLVSLTRARLPLAVWITSVDLTDARCGDLVDVDLTAAPSWRTPQDVGTPAHVEPGSALADALSWAVDSWEGSLDEDEDGCANVAESCRETLFNQQQASSCPDP